MAKGQTPNTNIKIESEIDFKSPTNLDEFRDKFKIRVLLVDENNTVTTSEIVTVDLNIPFFEHHRYYLLANSEVKQLDVKYHYRPDYISYEEYGTTAFDFLILYINNLFSVTEFTLEYFYLPKLDAINELIFMNLQNYPYRNKIKSIEFM